MTIFQRMVGINPNRNPVFTAIDELKKPDEIRQFVKEYEEYLLEKDSKDIKGREREVARSNIGYILGYYDDETQKLWYSLLPQVSHPVFGFPFGRGGEVTLEEAYEKGREMGANMLREREKKKSG